MSDIALPTAPLPQLFMLAGHKDLLSSKSSSRITIRKLAEVLKLAVEPKALRSSRKGSYSTSDALLPIHTTTAEELSMALSNVVLEQQTAEDKSAVRPAISSTSEIRLGNVKPSLGRENEEPRLSRLSDLSGPEVGPKVLLVDDNEINIKVNAASRCWYISHAHE